jgi:RecB family endonuclease NucS
MVIEWDSSYTSSLRKGYIVELFQSVVSLKPSKQNNGAMEIPQPAKPCASVFCESRRNMRSFLPGAGWSLEATGKSRRMLKAHLRDFLAKNLDRIEPGLRLFEADGRNGVEFPVDHGRVDLLAVDRDQKFVVVELKLSQGRYKVLGQILYYMGWVDKHLGHGPCRGYIIASEISDELSVAASRVVGVNLAKYRMSFAIEPISAQGQGL